MSSKLIQAFVGAVFLCGDALAQALGPLPGVLPAPVSAKFSNSSVYLGIDFHIFCGSMCPDPLPAAISRYVPLIFAAGTPASPGTLKALTVSIDAAAPLALGVDETYQLVVPDDGSAATIHSANQWGALRGLETFSQLVSWQKDYAGTSNGTYAIRVAPVSVQDSPRWRWRGVLIDSSRHFLPVNTIRAILESMSYSKLNVLHWHLIDDQSWPLVSTTYPSFSQAGAFAPDATYSHNDVTTIVDFAWDRGIIVVPEFDMPGHAAIWGQGYPNLAISCPTGETLLNPIPTSTSGTLDVYTVLDGLLQEFLPLFKSPPLVHLGGDEVFNTTCWNESAAVASWAASNGFAPYDMFAVRDYFETTVQQVVAKHQASTVFWEEVWNGGFKLQDDTIVNAWLNTTDIPAVLQSGRRCVSAYGLYLNRAQPQAPLVPVHYAFQDTWQDFYRLDPLAGLNKTLTPSQLDLFLGETVSQWGIQYDASNILTNLWPRAAAAAERMWSPADVTDIASAEARIEAQGCRMVQRGIPSGPLGSGYCPTRGSPGLPPIPAVWQQVQAQLAVDGRVDA